MTVRAVICDLGGVVIRIDPDRIRARWAARSALPADAVHVGFPDAVYEAFERDELTPVEYLAHVRETLRLDGTDAELADDFNALYLGVDEAVVAHLTRLRERGWTVVALTNTNRIHEPVWAQRYAAALAVFDAVHCSHDLRARKPEPAAFTAVLDAHGLAASDTVFVDDTLRNVRAATALGMHGVHFTDAQDLGRQLAALIPGRPRGADGVDGVDGVDGEGDHPADAPSVELLRPRVVQLLAVHGTEAGTIVHAPTGWGKTTALRQWWEAAGDAAGPGSVSLTLTEADTGRVWERVADALAAEGATDGEVLPHPDTITRALAPRTAPTFITLDGLDTLPAYLVEELVTFVRAAPPLVFIVVATRAPLPAELEGFAADEVLVRLGPRELAFRPAEVARLWQQLHGTEPEPATVEAILARTDGQPAAVARLVADG